MKIHIIENGYFEECKKINKPELILEKNDIDYLKMDDNTELWGKVEEEDCKYNYDNRYKNNFNDKIMRQILKDKYQASMYLNEWLNIKPGYEIKPEEIEEVTESYITKNWVNRETDIVYKDKKYDGVFYLIEHQTKVDYKMAKRIVEYKNEIENHYEINRSKEETENAKKIANVTALVIYIEDETWKAKRNIYEIKIKNPRLRYNTKEDYELICINNYTLEELEAKVKTNEENIILKLALINKLGQIKNEEIMLKEMKNIKITPRQIDYIASYINERIVRKQGNEVAKLMIKSIEEKLEKEEEENMLEAFVDRFLDMADEKERKGKIKGEKIGEKRGITQGINQVAINMLRQKYKKEEIKKCTGLSDAKIKELEKTIQNA